MTTQTIPSLSRSQEGIGNHQAFQFEDDPISTPARLESRQDRSRKPRFMALAGSSLLQLPIWGFAMNFGVFQEYYTSNWTLNGSREITGIIGTTSNGVMYLSMPFLFAMFTRRWAQKRQTAAVCGTFVTCASFLLSSYSSHVWHLVATQGITSAVGCALIYSPMTVSLGEWYSTGNRAAAYGMVLSCKNIVGSTCPFLFRYLLSKYDFRTTMQLWTAITAATSLLGIILTSTPSSRIPPSHRTRRIPWHFLRHQKIYMFCAATALQSSGYGIPQTYLSTYAREVAKLSQTSATLLLTIFNVPGIVSSSFFGYLSDNRHVKLSAATVTSISAISSALSASLLWGLSSRGSTALLILFSLTFGCFAGGYSAIWGGMVNELEREAAQMNENIDTGLLYGLLNGARGIGYVSGGLAGVPLLKVGSHVSMGQFAYGTMYGPLILFTIFSSALGGGSFWHMLAHAVPRRLFVESMNHS